MGFDVVDDFTRVLVHRASGYQADLPLAINPVYSSQGKSYSDKDAVQYTNSHDVTKKSDLLILDFSGPLSAATSRDKFIAHVVVICCAFSSRDKFASQRLASKLATLQSLSSLFEFIYGCFDATERQQKSLVKRKH